MEDLYYNQKMLIGGEQRQEGRLLQSEKNFRVTIKLNFDRSLSVKLQNLFVERIGVYRRSLPYRSFIVKTAKILLFRRHEIEDSNEARATRNG